MFRSISSGVMTCLLLSHAAAAQPGRIEAWGGLNLVGANLDTTVTTRYVPLIESYSPPLAGSTAGQTVQVNAGRTAGFGAGLNVFLSRHVGVQFLFDADSRDLEGGNGNYTTLLNYTAGQPPDYVERVYSTSSTFTSCGASPTPGCVLPTTGALKQRTLGFNVVGRWPAGPRVNLELSGGLVYAAVRASAAALRYTSFNMGGHSTLFSQEYQLSYSIGPAHAFGMNAGMTLDVGMGKATAFTIDARYVGAPAVASPVTVRLVANRDSISFVQDVATIQKNLHPPEAQISPARVRVLFGVKVRM